MAATATDTHDVTDSELLQRYLDGEADAFAALVRRYRHPLFGYLVRFTRDRALADDVFQETFLQVHNSAARFDTSRRFKPWLYTVASNKARDALRKKSRQSAAPLDASATDGSTTTYSDLLPSDIPSPDEISANKETARAVHTMVAELPDHLREVLALSYFSELPYKDIAEALSIPIGTVKSRLHAAIKAFAEKWKKHVPHSQENDANDTSSRHRGA